MRNKLLSGPWKYFLLQEGSTEIPTHTHTHITIVTQVYPVGTKVHTSFHLNMATVFIPQLWKWPAAQLIGTWVADVNNFMMHEEISYTK